MDGFNVQDILRDFVKELGDMRPELQDTLARHYTTIDSGAEVQFFTDTYRPLAMEFVKKDESIFDRPQLLLRGIDFSLFWKDLNERKKNSVWDFCRTALVASYIGDNWVQSLKDLWSKHTGKESSEIDEVLNDTATKSNIEELFEFFKETRIFKLGMEVVENLNIESLGLGEIDFSDIGGLLEMVKNPEHPVTKKAI
jgi:hypothetical protein